MALLIKADGNVLEISTEDLQHTEKWREWLGDWAEHVGFISHVKLGGKVWVGMLVAESGKLNGLPYNARASKFLVLGGINDFVAGDAIVYEKGELQ